MAPGCRGKGAHISPHQDSSQLANILNPVLGIRDSQRRAGLIPVDHAKHNRDAIKNASRTNRERRFRGEDPVAMPDVLRGRSPGSASTSPTAGRRGSSFGPPDGPNRVVEVSARDYVHENAVEAAAVPRRRRQAKGDDGRQWLCKDDYGLVPDYLHKLRLDMATEAAEQQVAAEAARMPAGMRVLEEEERRELLDALSRSKHDTEAQLRALPFVIETPTQKKNKRQIEERLAEIEDALRIFSQRRVLVRSDDVGGS